MNLYGDVFNTWQMRKTLSGILVFILLLIPTQLLNAASAKAGSACTKLGQNQVVNGYRYTCIKSGKKLIWDKGVRVKTLMPIPSPSPSTSTTITPSPSPLPLPSSTPSVALGPDGYPLGIPAPGRTCPFSEGSKATLYGGNLTCINGIWILDSGSTISFTPSPQPSTSTPSSTLKATYTAPLDTNFCSGNNLAPIQLTNANNKHNLVVTRVTEIWKKCKTQLSKSFTPLTIQLEPGYEETWKNESSLVANLLISIFEGNGEKLNQDPIVIFGDSDAWLSNTGSKYECSSKIPNQPLGIYCGHIMAGYGYFVLGGSSSDQFTSNKKLTSDQKKVLVYMVGHDISTMYELQAQYGSLKYDGTKNQIPAWIREGFVQIFSGQALTDYLDNGNNYYENLVKYMNFEPFKNSLCEKNLQDFESKDRNWGNSCISSQNLYAVELLVAKHGGFTALFDFVKRFGMTDDWPNSFKLAFGISREDFYAEWYEYLNIPLGERPAIKPAAPSVHY